MRLLVTLSIVHGLSLLIWPGLALISGFAFDDPRSAKSWGLWTCFGAILSWPIPLLIALIGGWLSYRLGAQAWAVRLMLLPFVNVVAFVIGLIGAIWYFSKHP